MQAHVETMMKSLVAVAWADGRVNEEESEVIDALVEAFELQAQDAEAIRQYAKSPRRIEELPLSDLSHDDRRMLLQHAVLVTYVDGTQSDKELEVLGSLADQLHIPAEERSELLQLADARAQRLLPLLKK